MPRDPAYGDRYYSQHNGLEESEYVFLEGNGFPKRWPEKATWTIGETGFGTGLNFLACWRSWQQHSGTSGQLTFISTELHPIPLSDLRKTLATWPELSEFSEPLLAQWPPAVGGFHSLSFHGGRVRLLLLFGDAIHAFSQLNARVDAWFLDGFAPSTNPGLWNDALYAQLRRLSSDNASLATFTAVGDVRRALIAQGFAMQRRPGYRWKRHMLQGSINTTEVPGPAEPVTRKHVVIIGAGLAGCSAAYALAKRGVSVTVLEQSSAHASKASAIPAAVTRPFPDQSLSPAARLSIDGFSFSKALFKQQGLDDAPGAIWCDDGSWSDLPEHFASNVGPGKFNASKGLLFAQAQTVNVAELCGTLLEGAKVSPVYGTTVTAVRRHEATQQWQVILGSGACQSLYDAVVVCSGNAAKTLHSAVDTLESRAVRGQLSGYQSPPALDQIICGNGHVARHKQTTWVGSSFVPGDTQSDIRDRDREVVTEKVSELTGGWSDQLSGYPRVDWAGIRHTSADHLPFVGQLIDQTRLRQRYARDKPRRGEDIDSGCRVSGLYASLAHGSRGTVTAPISGELIAAMICNDPLPLPIPVIRAIDPSRGPVKAIRQE